MRNHKKIQNGGREHGSIHQLSQKSTFLMKLKVTTSRISNFLITEYWFAVVSTINSCRYTSKPLLFGCCVKEKLNEVIALHWRLVEIPHSECYHWKGLVSECSMWGTVYRINCTVTDDWQLSEHWRTLWIKTVSELGQVQGLVSCDYPLCVYNIGQKEHSCLYQEHGRA